MTAEEQQRNAIIVERTRFAREIHDTLAQGFTGIMMQLNAASQRLDGDAPQARLHLEKARELAQSSLDEARRSVSALRAGVLTNSTLFEAVQQVGQELAAGSKVAVDTQLEGVPQALPEGFESHLLRIGQEALTNAIRHSGADRINVRLSYQPDSVVLEVEDNGKGGALTAASGFGIEGMRDRARQIGGQIDIRSRPGKGTRLVIIIPNA
jgi:signal transduction histidine kinase